jgi:ABC-type multidrug transport system ATPase subunit
MPSTDVILRTNGLSKRFGKRFAVRNLDVEVLRGDIYGFLGPNGAGKSTTIRMVLSLITPTSGTVTLFDRDAARDRSVFARVGGLVEKPDFYLYLSGRRNLEIVAALYGHVPTARIDEVLRLVGLFDRAGDRVKAYSHGMKQRLGIAQALLANPDLLILDEPTNGLDPQGMKEVRDLILALNRDQGMTIFLSSHLLNEIEQVATRMCILHQGELVVQGAVRELLSRERITVRVYTDAPAAARERLAALAGVTDLAEHEDHVSCAMPEAVLASANAALVQAGIAVSGFVPRRSLEDYFLSITENVAPAAAKR